MSQLHFSKIVATGNDFLFIDARTPLPEPFARVARRDLAESMCDRHLGPGADGLVFVEELSGVSGNRLRWDFYNSDGSVAEMCGNASRCMGRWVIDHLHRAEAEFDTTAGAVRVEAGAGDVIRSHLKYLNLQFTKLDYEVGGTKKHATFLNTGVPHAVVEVADLCRARQANDDIQALRFHPATGERGTNVTFLQIISPDRFATVTFERGVEGFTLSCGTGVLAAAAVGLRHSKAARAELTTPGGTLAVSFGENWRGAMLEGSARVVYDGVLAAAGKGVTS